MVNMTRRYDGAGTVLHQHDNSVAAVFPSFQHTVHPAPTD